MPDRTQLMGCSSDVNHLSHESQTCYWTLHVKINRDWEAWWSSACRTNMPAGQSLNSISINKNLRQREVLQELRLVFMKPVCQLEPFVWHVITFTKVLYLLTWWLNGRLTLLSNFGSVHYRRMHPSPRRRLKNVFWGGQILQKGTLGKIWWSKLQTLF